MITKRMQKWLEKKRGSQSMRYVYVWRIQDRIERELDMLLWLAVNRPDIFLMDDKESAKSNERLKKLLLVVKVLNSNCEVELTKTERE